MYSNTINTSSIANKYKNNKCGLYITTERDISNDNNILNENSKE